MIQANRTYWTDKQSRGHSSQRQTQNWTVGNTVRVGFMTLRVTGRRAIVDGLPDIYTLESLDGKSKYEFIPHNGLNRIA